MSILQDSDFLERMLLSLGIPAVLSAGFFVWWLVDGAPEPQARVSAARVSAARVSGPPRLFESDSILGQPSSGSDPAFERTNAVTILSDAATAPDVADRLEADPAVEEEDPEAEARRARFSALEEQFDSELRSGRRAPQTAEFLNKELSERFARLSSIDIDSDVVCTGSVCQVTLASAESVATLLASSNGTIHHLLPGSVPGALSEAGAAETRARYQATNEVLAGQPVEGIRFLVPRESIQESQAGAAAPAEEPAPTEGRVAEPITPQADVSQEGSAESDQPPEVQKESLDVASDEEPVNQQDDEESEEE